MSGNQTRGPAALPARERDSREWWAALARHELLLQRCDTCAALRWPARAICNRCAALAWSWQRASGRGEVASWIVNRHDFGVGPESPYVVLLVRLAEQEDLLLPGGFDGPADGSGLAVGLPVVAGFEDREVPASEPALALLRWRLAGR